MRVRFTFVGLGLSFAACSEPTLPPASPETVAPSQVQSPSGAPASSGNASAPLIAASSAASASPRPARDVRLAMLLVPLSDARDSVDDLPTQRMLRATTPALRACVDTVGGPGKVWITGRISKSGSLEAMNVAYADLPDSSARCILGVLQKTSVGASSQPLALSVVASLREPSGSASIGTDVSASAPPPGEETQEFGMRGLSATGEGGGGRGEGIGVGSIGTIGHGAETLPGQGFGSSGRLGGPHAQKPPRLTTGATNVSGRLPPEVIQRVVRQNFGRFRLCYEKGLFKDPNLAGKVAIRFVIETDGSVSSASSDTATALADAAVVTCTAKAFAALSFPAPEGGKVTVVYPISFSPGDDATQTSTKRVAAKAPTQKKSIRVAGQPLEKLVAGDLVRALRDGDIPNSSVVLLDEKPGSPFVVFTESSGEILAIQRVLAPKKGEAPLASTHELEIFERSDVPAKRYAIRVLGRNAQLAGELTERIVE